MEAGTVVTVYGASEADLDELGRVLRDAGAETGPTVREPAAADLNFDPTIIAVGAYKVLAVVGPPAAKALADWIVARLEKRRREGSAKDEPDLVVEVRGERISISGTASPEAIRLAVDAALAARS